MIYRKTAFARLSPAPAKITPPQLTENVYLRKRLFKALDNARKRPIIWISAPAGSGKTTLVASYLNDKKLPCIWYQIDEGDGDIASFFHYMGIAAKHANPRKKKPLPNLTPEYLRGLPTFTRNFFRELYSKVSKSQSIKGSKRSDTLTYGHSDTNRRFAIVLDNYQDVPVNSLLHEIIQIGLSEIPDGINFIIISRTEPPSAFAGLRANNRTNILGWNELKLSFEETCGIVQLKAQKKLSKGIIRELHDKTNGWAAGLVLMLEHQDLADLIQRHGSGFTTQSMFDYFVSEIFQKLDEASQEILLQTAFLPIMTARLAERLTDSHQAGGLLAELNRRGYFTEKKPLPEVVYQYHPLFREFLLAQARQQLTDAQLIQTQRRAAEILEEVGQFEDAIVLYNWAGDWLSMARVILANAHVMIAQGRSQTLEIWLRAIPEELHKEQPWLLYWLGECRLLTNPLEAHDCFKRAFDMFREQGDTNGVFKSWSGAVDALVYNYGDITPLDHWIAVAEEIQIAYKAFISPEMGARMAATLFFCLAMRQPQHPEMNALAERALLLTENIPDANLALLTRLHFIFYCLWTGDIGRAGLTLESLRRFLSEATPFLHISEKMFRAHYYWHTAQFDFCQKAVLEGLALARTSGIHVWDFSLLGNGITGALNAGDYGAAAKMLEQLSLAAKSPQLVDAGAYHFLASWYALLQKDITSALRHAETSLNLVKALGWPLYEALSHLSMALVLHEMAEHERASEHLAKCMDISRRIRSRILEWRCLLTEAQFALDQGNDEKGLNALRQAMSVGKKGGYLSHSYWQPSVMARLCAIALEHGIEVDYVQSLIKKHRLLLPEGFLSEKWPYTIKIYTLGQFSLCKDGKALRFAGKAQHKPMALLNALIAMGGREVSAVSLMETLWPEADGDVARRAFDTTLHRLRKLVSDKALRLEEGRLTLDACYVWVDAWVLGRILGEMEKRLKETKPQKEILHRLLDKAVAMYHGQFLREDMEPYLLAPRERLHQKMLSLLKELGSHWEEEQCYEDAISCYEKGLSIEPAVEAFYQRLMLTYQRLGQNAEAIAAYKRCQQALRTLLNISPSQQTEEIYKKLMQIT